MSCRAGNAQVPPNVIPAKRRVEKPGSESGCHGQADHPALWMICLSVSFSHNPKKDTDKEDRARKPLGLPCPWHPCNQTVVFIDRGFSTSPKAGIQDAAHPCRQSSGRSECPLTEPACTQCTRGWIPAFAGMTKGCRLVIVGRLLILLEALRELWGRGTGAEGRDQLVRSEPQAGLDRPGQQR